MTISAIAPLDALRGWLQADPAAFGERARRAVARAFRKLRHRPRRTFVDELTQMSIATALDPHETARVLDLVDRACPVDAPHLLDLICFRNVDRHVKRMRRQARHLPLDSATRDELAGLVGPAEPVGETLWQRGLGENDVATVGAFLREGDAQRAAEALGITHGALRVRLARIRRRLRERDS